MKQNREINVEGTQITVKSINEQDYISLTDMVRDIENGLALIEKWLRNKNTIEFLGIWERMYNNNFNSPEFEGIKNNAGLNRFVLSVKRWVKETNAIKQNLLPNELSKQQINMVYASEADILNMALFGKTAQEWRGENSGEKGNIRDYANVSQLVCLSNLENLNAHFIQEGINQSERLRKLNQIAIQQMELLLENRSVKKLDSGTTNECE